MRRDARSAVHHPKHWSSVSAIAALFLLRTSPAGASSHTTNGARLRAGGKPLPTPHQVRGRLFGIVL